MRRAFKSFRFNWLCDATTPPLQVNVADGDPGWQTYPLPPDLAQGGFENLDLALGMAVFRAEHRFTPKAMGRMIPLAEVTSEFAQPTFMVQTVARGRILHRERHPDQDLIYGAGLSLFRHVTRFQIVPCLDGSADSQMVSLSLADQTLAMLLGEEASEQLLAALDISSLPSTVVKPVPSSVTDLLQHSMSTTLTGRLRALHCQAKCLEYLAALSGALCAAPQRPPNAVQRATRQTIHDLHGFLLTLEGQLPTLDELARQFGMPARRLNEAFATEFGESIFSFLSNQRLDSARAALTETTAPIKVISARLGYAHVNNFSAAFRRRFGITPGSCRKTRQHTPE